MVTRFRGSVHSLKINSITTNDWSQGGREWIGYRMKGMIFYYLNLLIIISQVFWFCKMVPFSYSRKRDSFLFAMIILSVTIFPPSLFTSYSSVVVDLILGSGLRQFIETRIPIKIGQSSNRWWSLQWLEHHSFPDSTCQGVFWQLRLIHHCSRDHRPHSHRVYREAINRALYNDGVFNSE